MRVTPETRHDHEIRYGVLQIILKAVKKHSVGQKSHSVHLPTYTI